MNIGLFTDTYFPQVSGVATSIKTLRDELIAQGHHVYIFTSSDPRATDSPADGIYRFPSVPFVSFKDRRIAFTGWFKVLRIARKLQLDIVHNQTEFSLGVMGKFVAKEMGIPCLHTYHTMYQDYLHYIANGRILKPKDVARLAHFYLKNMSGIVAPSERVLDVLESYHVESPIRIIPTGVNLRVYELRDTTAQKQALRSQYGYQPDTPVMLSLSRLAFEKNIGGLIAAMPDIIAQEPRVQLLIVGDGPARASLERQVREMNLRDHVTFAGQIDNDQVPHYYQMADVFVSASDSESQGLTYDEALASDLPIVVRRSEYTDQLIDDPGIGLSFQKRSELVQGVINYLHNPPSPEATIKRQQKLHDISAAVFGRRVIEFYEDCQAQLKKEQALTPRHHHAFHRSRRF
ncbi:glycosyltransferase family 4 protein [Limosilactobacillus caecicola]|uniref:glycosyltransferase family 4 protein n=1 Tax=Limosilactobacillus caecicola TaxID=2941332 RepID=UPI0020418D25|nr:glycosyltransferase family 4 protein [Limosilactobacillus caecicola]